MAAHLNAWLTAAQRQPCDARGTFEAGYGRRAGLAVADLYALSVRFLGHVLSVQAM
jgi:hypothetical protein